MRLVADDPASHAAAALAAKFTFQCTSDDRRRPLPHKILFGLGVNETARHIMLKFLGWVLFYRYRLAVETDVQNDAIPFVPDLCQLGYDMRPLLWVECGECSVGKLHKLAVKCPEAELWVIKGSPGEVQTLLRGMAKEELRRDRYSLLALDPEVFEELVSLCRERNQFHLHRADFEERHLQFEFNELWFDTTFEVYRF
ncbi:MAG: YaeQ family protein [Verrucomicrobia bacterium]|nr:YaeQ family protein [Verrucomicrobiota bacterium]